MGGSETSGIGTFLPEHFDLGDGGAEVSAPQSLDQRLDRRLRVGLRRVWHAHVLLTVESRFRLLQAALQDGQFF